MGLLKKLGKSLSISKDKKKETRGGSQFGSDVRPGSSDMGPSIPGSDFARLQHLSDQDPVTNGGQRGQSGSGLGNGSVFVSFGESKQNRAIAGAINPVLNEPNISEIPNQGKEKKHKRGKSKQSFDGERTEKVFQRPRLGQFPIAQFQSNGTTLDAPSSSSAPPTLDTRNDPAVALTVIIDPSLASARGSSANIMNDIAVGVLNLMRALAPSDTISIFGCDKITSGVFSYPADKESYPKILDLVCHLHTEPTASYPKLYDSIVQVVEELSHLSPVTLKPLVIMSDYLPKEAMGTAFDAQHALLWSSAQHLQSIFVSVWDPELYTDVTVKTSKEVHIETLSSEEIAAAFLVMQSYLKTMIKDHKLKLESEKLRTIPAIFENDEDMPFSSAATTAREGNDSHLDHTEIQPEMLQGLPSPDITDRKAEQSPEAPEDQPFHSPERSSRSSWDQKGSEFDSTANFAASSEGYERSLTDFADEMPKDRERHVSFESLDFDPAVASASDNYDSGGHDKHDSVDQDSPFKGFKGPQQMNPLFLDNSESGSAFESVKMEDGEEEDSPIIEVPWDSIDLKADIYNRQS